MISSLGRLAAVLATALAAVAALTACGKVATDDSVEEQIKSQLGTDSSDCPTDLKGEQGQSILCKATKGDEACIAGREREKARAVQQQPGRIHLRPVDTVVAVGDHRRGGTQCCGPDRDEPAIPLDEV